MNVTGGGIEIVPAGVIERDGSTLASRLSIATSALTIARSCITDESLITPVLLIKVDNYLPNGIKTVYKDVATGNIIVVDTMDNSIHTSRKNLAITDNCR